MVVTQQSAQPIATLHRAFTIGTEVMLDDLVFETLVVPFQAMLRTPHPSLQLEIRPAQISQQTEPQ